MSDLYLELRSRIPVVAQQTHIGRARLQDAQDAVGLSNESIARKVPVSEKTWRRWKEKGAVPTSSLPAVAKALRLELRELDASPGGEDIADRLDQLTVLLQALASRVDAGFLVTATALEALGDEIAKLSVQPQRASTRSRQRGQG